MNNRTWDRSDLVALFIITFIITTVVLDTKELIEENNACEIKEQTKLNPKT